MGRKQQDSCPEERKVSETRADCRMVNDCREIDPDGLGSSPLFRHRIPPHGPYGANAGRA